MHRHLFARPLPARLRFVVEPGTEPNGAGPATSEQPPAEPEPQGQDKAGEDPGDDGEEPGKDWKASSRFWERRAKANAEAAKALPDVEAERDALATELETVKTTALRAKVAATHGISDEDAAMFLTGTEEKELTAQAERLAALRTPTGALFDPTAGKTGNPAPTDDLAAVAALFGRS